MIDPTEKSVIEVKDENPVVESLPVAVPVVNVLQSPVNPAVGVADTNRKRRYWAFRPSKRLATRARKLKNNFKKLLKKMNRSSAGPCKSQAASPESVPGTTIMGDKPNPSELTVTVPKLRVSFNVDSTNVEPNDNDVEAEIYTPNFYRTPCTTNGAGQLVKVTNGAIVTSELFDCTNLTFPTNTTTYHQTATFLAAVLLLYAETVARKNTMAVSLRYPTARELAQTYQTNIDMQAAAVLLTIFTEFVQPSCKFAVLVSSGCSKLIRPQKQIRGNSPKLICDAPKVTARKLVLTPPAVQSEEARLAAEKRRADKGVWMANVRTIGSSFFMHRLYPGAEYERAVRSSIVEDLCSSEKDQKVAVDCKDESTESEWEECDEEEEPDFEEEEKEEDSDDDSDGEELQIVADALNKLSKASKLQLCSNYFAVPTCSAAKWRSPAEICGMRGEMDDILKDLAVASTFLDFNEDVIAMGHKDFQQAAIESFLKLERGAEEVQIQLLAPFVDNAVAAFNFAADTFRNGFEHADKFADIQRVFVEMDLYDYDAVLELLIEAQLLMGEVSLWQLEVELAVQKARQVTQSVAPTLENYKAGTIGLTERTKRVVDFYKSYFSNELVPYYLELSADEIHCMHGFEQQKFEDVRWLWVADRMVMDNSRVVKQGVEALCDLSEGLGESLKVVIDTGKRVLENRRNF